MQEHCSRNVSIFCHTDSVNDGRPTRASARLLQIERIKAISRRLISEKGAPGLSLREVARDMGVVSSALYRYFPTRDDLLTSLIVDAYNDLGSSAERAARKTRGESPRRQMLSVASAIRRWAKAHPNEYALLYGSPVPGYEAPEFTVEPASRVALALSAIVADAWRGFDVAAVDDDVPVPTGLLETRTLDEIMPGVPESVRVRCLMVWSQIFGCVSFELFGHYKGSVRNANRFFDAVINESANLVLPPD